MRALQNVETANRITAFYCVVQGLIFAAFAFLWVKVSAFVTEREAEYEGKIQPTFVVKAPPLPMGMENPEPDQTMTDPEYDMHKLQELVKQQVIQVGICVAMANYMGTNGSRILFLQGCMSPFTLLSSNLIAIYVKGEPATGDLRRPWAPPPGMFDEIQKQLNAGQETMKTKKMEKRENKKAFIDAQRAKKNKAK